MTFLCALCMFVVHPAPAQPRTISGKVVEVITGSKLVVSNKGRRFLVSLREAACPEPGQPFHDEALRFAEQRVDGLFVIVTVDSIEENQVVGELEFIDNRILSYELLQAGMAFWNQPTGKSNRYKALEEKARKSRMGIFEKPGAEPPWVIQEREQAQAENKDTEKGD